jgi:hypothetical protein
MKQTAVEFLNEQLLVLFRERKENLIDTETFYKQKEEVFKSAIEMEKNQSINFLKSVFQQDNFDYKKAYLNFKKK